MQPQRLVQLEELPEPAPDQQTGRQMVAALAAQHYHQFTSRAQAPTASHSPSAACPAQALHGVRHFYLATLYASQIYT